MWAIQRGFLKAPHFEDPRLKQSIFEKSFPNPLGLAAGFDKNAVALDFWHQLGFGFVECGTITHLAQTGNPKPRLFRLPEDQALINRLGFNNEGARAVATRLASSRAQIPVGINLGKSKLVDLPMAADDYQQSFRLLHRFGDYFVINVSSPNTPGLRALQDKGPLQEIISALREVDSARPLLIKIAPDLDFEAIDQIIELTEQNQLAGIVATNTTISRDGLIDPSNESGGLSGRPLRELSDRILGYVAKHASKDLVIIGVGGIDSGDDLFKKIGLGAHMCQLYTGWVYGGPRMVAAALERLLFLMEREGMKSLKDLRGSMQKTNLV